MDFDKTKVYGDTSITDGLVSFDQDKAQNSHQASSHMLIAQVSKQVYYSLWKQLRFLDALSSLDFKFSVSQSVIDIFQISCKSSKTSDESDTIDTGNAR